MKDKKYAHLDVDFSTWQPTARACVGPGCDAPVHVKEVKVTDKYMTRFERRYRCELGHTWTGDAAE